MENTFEEIRRQIHEIRNFLAPFDLKLTSLEERFADMRLSLGGFESKLLACSFTVEEQALKLIDLLDRVRWIEMALKIPPRPAPRSMSVWSQEPPAPAA